MTPPSPYDGATSPRCAQGGKVSAYGLAAPRRRHLGECRGRVPGVSHPGGKPRVPTAYGFHAILLQKSNTVSLAGVLPARPALPLNSRDGELACRKQSISRIL